MGHDINQSNLLQKILNDRYYFYFIDYENLTSQSQLNILTPPFLEKNIMMDDHPKKRVIRRNENGFHKTNT